MSRAQYQMQVDKDVTIEVSDSTLLRANVFRPNAEGRFPVVMAQGVYGKDIHFADGYKMQWDGLLKVYPDLCRNGSSGQ